MATKKTVAPVSILENDAYPLVGASFLDKAWALLPSKLEEIATLIESRLAGDKPDFAAASRGKAGNRSADRYQVQNGVAVIPVYGVLDKRMNLMMDMSGGTSTELLSRDIGQALADPQVDALLLDMESPGGSVDGTKEVADLVHAARSQGKPIVAYANGLMASAAYWIGSAAAVVVANETAQVGSIGVAMMHVDRSGMDEKIGIKRTAIYAGKYKRMASDEKPLSDEGQKYLQGMVDDYYGIFLEAVAQNRGVDIETVHEKMADGRLFIGKKALKAGLVDKIGTFDDALSLAQQLGGKTNMDMATLQAQHPEVFQQVKDLGAGEVTMELLVQRHPESAEYLRAEGEARERTRVMEILSADGDPAVTLQAITEGMPLGDAYKAFHQAEKDKRGQALADLEGGAPKSMGQTGDTTGDPGTFEAKVEQFMAEKKISRGEATKMAARDFPKLHQAFIQRQQPGTQK
jgi:capsid assembly protease